MFPYNEKPISTPRTSLDIECFGRQALLRALNIGRVVAFVGSGTSIKFGQPDWRSISKRGLELFFALETAIIAHEKWQEKWDDKWQKAPQQTDLVKDFRETLSPLVNDIKELRHCQDFEVSHLVELIEDYFREVCPLLERHGIEQKDLEKSVINLDDLCAKLWRGHEENACPDPNKGKTDEDRKDWIDYHFGPKPGDLPENLALTISDFRRAFANQFQSREASEENTPDTGTGTGTGKMAGKESKKSKETLKKAKPFSELVTGLGLGSLKSIQVLDDEKANISKTDAARVLKRRLGVRRYLTLNYDLELEMMLFEEGRATPLDAYDKFEKFLLQQEPPQNRDLPYEPGRAVKLQSPSGKVIRSSSSRRETLADLFSFGAFPTNYDASVHHLHGRLDDPENMIVTAKDYQSIYYGASDQKKSFDEARHAVFTGSDILVLGMGTKEHDVLKPLRDFLELEADRRDAHGKVYYITALEFSGKHKRLKDAHDAARRDAMAKTQSLYKDYGMHTLFIDHSFEKGRSRAWTQESATLFAARAEIAFYKRAFASLPDEPDPEQSMIEPWKSKDLKEDFENIFGNIQSLVFRKDASRKTQDDIRFNDSYPATQLARSLVSNWNLSCMVKDKNLSDRAETISKTLKALDSHLRDIGLAQYGKKLERARRLWWEDWSAFPGLRVAAFGPHRYALLVEKDHTEDDLRKQANDPDFVLPEDSIDGPIIWRQTNLVAHFRTNPMALGDPEDTPQFSGVLTATGKARKDALDRVRKIRRAQTPKWGLPLRRPSSDIPALPTRFPASVARLSIPPGGGKGRLLTYFTTRQKIVGGKDIWVFQSLFNAAHADPKTKVTPEASKDYRACFMSHLTFALEFSGTMIAFARLLQQMLPELRKEVTAHGGQDDPEWDDLINHQFQKRRGADPCIATLRTMFALLQKYCPPGGWKTRILAIFSYLDRLVDDRGDAYSPSHRAFFRLISGWNDEEAHMRLPFDLVLINCHADRPIRYLSREVPVKPGKDKRRDAQWQDRNWVIRHDRKVALEHWTELESVRPRVIFAEALEHAVQRTSAYEMDGETPEVISSDIQKALGFFKPKPGDPRDKKRVDHDFMPLPPNLKRFMYRRVSNGHLVAGLACTIWDKVAGDEHRETAFRKEWERCLSALDIAYAREKSRGLIDELMGIYRRLDRENLLPGELDTSRLRSTPASRNLERLRTMMIDHLALLQVPVSAETLAACPDLETILNKVAGTETGDKAPTKVLAQELELLVARGFAARYKKFAVRLKETSGSENDDPASPDCVYVLNSKVAGVLRARANLEVFSQYKLMVFQPNVYPSQPERALKPDMDHFERVSSVVRALVKSTHTEAVEEYWKMRQPGYKWPKDQAADQAFADRMEVRNDKLRAAYALLRGTFSISVIARLTEKHARDRRIAPFDEYRTWTRKLLNTATLLSKIRALDMEQRLEKEQRLIKDERPRHINPLPYNHAFLRDEISWLYNERALVSFLQGRLFDALPLFEQAQVMLGSTLKRSVPQSEGATQRRIQMNFALAQVERGNIVTARETLERIIVETGERWKNDTPSVVHCMAKGYRALCDHLTNEFTRAQQGYEDVLANIGQFNHPRAESIFRRHYADLLRSMSTSRNDPEYKDAISHLRSSEELALGIRATDLHHYAIMAQARLHRDMHERGQALESLRQVEEYARAMGIQKMLCEVLKVRGEVLLAEGETTQAGFVTAQSIAISKRNGMRLRKISAAIIQARILRERKQIKDAERLLHETISESQVLGYATKTSQAMSLLTLQQHPPA